MELNKNRAPNIFHATSKRAMLMVAYEMDTGIAVLKKINEQIPVSPPGMTSIERTKPLNPKPYSCVPIKIKI
jgi:hypothetical protein